MAFVEKEIGKVSLTGVQDHFPVSFESTGFVVKDFGVVCSSCGKENRVKDTVGSFSSPMKGLVVIDGDCVCGECGHKEKVFVRFHEDNRITALTKEGWRLFDFSQQKRVSFWSRVMGALGLAR